MVVYPQEETHIIDCAAVCVGQYATKSIISVSLVEFCEIQITIVLGASEPTFSLRAYLSQKLTITKFKLTLLVFLVIES